GVSTKIICALPDSAIPRTRLRVVCTLGETMETFEPTSLFSSVDLPTLGAPISATKPQRVSVSAFASGIFDGGLDRQRAGQHRGRRCLLRIALGRAGAFHCFDARQFDRDAEFRLVVGAAAFDLSVGGWRKTSRLCPFLQNRFRIP